MFKGIMSPRRARLRAGTSLLALGIGLAMLPQHPAEAGACGSGSGSSIATACTGPFSWTGGTLSNSGTISGAITGITANANVTTLTNSGTISAAAGTHLGNNTGFQFAAGLSVGSSGTVASINNTALISVSGSIASSAGSDILAGLYLDRGTITNLTNSGTIRATGTNSGYSSDNRIAGVVSGTGGFSGAGGTIGTLTNSGLISGTDIGILHYGNPASFGTLINNVGGSITGGTRTAVEIAGTGFGTIVNFGRIGGGEIGIQVDSYQYSTGAIGLIDNRSGGIITGTKTGLQVKAGSVGTVTNNGTISGSGSGIFMNGGTITTLTNNGTISGNSALSMSGGTISTLTNSGTISGSVYAINVGGGSISPITNSGVIDGNIQNTTGNNLTINGGSGSSVGTLTGGTITNTNSNLVFASGNILLQDYVNVSGRTLSNTGATVKLTPAFTPTIDGTYSQTGGGLLIAATSSSSYGSMSVTGPATVSNSTITISGSGLRLGTTMTIVRSGTSGTYTGDTASVVGSAGISASLAALGNNLVVCLGTWNGATCSAGSGNGTTDGVGSYTGNDSKLVNLSNIVQSLAAPQQAQAAAQLKPTPHAATTQAAVQPAMEVLAVVTAHVDNTRLARNDAGQSGIATGDSSHGLAMWGEVFGSTATQDRRADTDGFSVLSGGMLAGIDTAVANNWRIGGVLSYAQARVEDSGNLAGSSTRLNSYGLIGYASYTGNPWYVDMSAGGILHKYQTTRLSNLAGAAGIANGSHDGQQFIAKVEGGYPLTVGPKEWNTTMTPLAALSYSRLHQDGYTETDTGNGMALKVNDSTSHSVKSDFGAKIERGFHTGFGEFVPDMRALWRHEYIHTKQVTAADYTADDNGSAAFTARGPSPVQDSAILGVGLTMVRGDDLTLSAKYEVELADRFVGQTGRLRLRQTF